MNRVLYVVAVTVDSTAPSSTMSLTDVLGNVREVVDQVVRTGDEVVITRQGKAAAVLLSHDEYESLIETVDILSDEDAMAAVAESEAEFAAGDLSRIDS